MTTRRPLPSPPTMSRSNQPHINQFNDTDMYPSRYPYFASNHACLSGNIYDEPTTTLRGGTLLHKGFYDLLAMIPTPSPSRFLWGPSSPLSVIAGPRYEDLPPSTRLPASPPSQQPVTPVTPMKGRRISKDMVSNPTGFLYASLPTPFTYPSPFSCSSHLVHASDADQLEALLTRWGPDGLGKLGGRLFTLHPCYHLQLSP